MAVLSDNDRRQTWADVMRRADCPGNLTKADLRAAVDAIDSQRCVIQQRHTAAGAWCIDDETKGCVDDASHQ